MPVEIRGCSRSSDIGAGAQGGREGDCDWVVRRGLSVENRLARGLLQNHVRTKRRGDVEVGVGEGKEGAAGKEEEGEEAKTVMIS